MFKGHYSSGNLFVQTQNHLLVNAKLPFLTGFELLFSPVSFVLTCGYSTVHQLQN